MSSGRPYLASVLALAALTFGLAVPARAAGATPACRIAADQTRMALPLRRVAQRLAAGDPITIVALGSSSTAGAGASSPAANYPNRLAAELLQKFPRQKFKVINRGVNGEEVEQMLARLDTGVLAEKPDLVLWQLGTNSVLRDHPFKTHDAYVHDGVTRIKATGADVILIDPQFAPKVIAKPDAEAMVGLIANMAKQENVALFQRFALMRKWKEIDGIPFEAFVSPDGLHMNDWSYGCLAKALGLAISEAATRPVETAVAKPLIR